MNNISEIKLIKKIKELLKEIDKRAENLAEIKMKFGGESSQYKEALQDFQELCIAIENKLEQIEKNQNQK